MNTAASNGNISTSSQIKALGLTAMDTRKALSILALSESLIGLVVGKSEAKAAAKPARKIEPVMTVQ